MLKKRKRAEVEELDQDPVPEKRTKYGTHRSAEQSSAALAYLKKYEN